MDRNRGVIPGAFLLLALSASASAAPDTCAQDGGTAECVAPATGQWGYSVGNHPYWLGSPTGFVPDEQTGVAGLLDVAYNVFHACTASVSVAPWAPPPSGVSGSGSIYSGDPNAVHSTSGHYWYQEYTLGIEHHQQKYATRVTGTRSTDSVPPCANTLYSGSLGTTRNRLVDCPVGYQPNYYTAPTYTYCWRVPPPRFKDPRNLGPCNDCDLQVGNPLNVATGNKYQEERDYSGGGPFPLEYARRYNSLAFEQSQPPTTGPNFFIRVPNWRGTYDRVILFDDHSRFPMVRAYRHDGSVISFAPSGSVWVAEPTSPSVSRACSTHREIRRGGVSSTIRSRPRRTTTRVGW